MNASYSNILRFVHTKQELDDLESQLGILLSSVYKADLTFEEALKTLVSAGVAELVKSSITSSTNQKEVVVALQNLLVEVRQTEVVRLTMAFEPNENTVEKIHASINSGRKSNLVLQFFYDPKIIGGLVFEFRGKYYDYSLRKKIDNYLQKNRQEIITNVKGQ